MASVDLTSAAGNAAVAYQDALNQARNTQNALLRQYGFTMMGPTGDYSVEAAQRAFDPNVLFDRATGGIDQAKLAELAKGLTVGTGGLFGEIARGGATAEAEAIMGARAAGLRGGLAQQRRELAETMTTSQVSQAKNEFLAGLGEAMSPIGGAFQNLRIAEAQDKLAMEEAAAIQAGLPTMPAEETVTPEAATPSALDKVFTSGGILPSASRGAYNASWKKTENTPKNPKPGQAFVTKSGDRIIYRTAGPKGAGWYKKG